jgi:hypothetical protein
MEKEYWRVMFIEKKNLILKKQTEYAKCCFSKP